MCTCTCCKHRHRRRKLLSETGYAGPVAPPGLEVPSAHGGVRELWSCSCGARQAVNVNYPFYEYGPWDAAAPRVRPASARHVAGA